MNYKAIIVDDEQIHADIIERLTRKNFSQIDVVGHAKSIEELESLNSLFHPDILFLDINLGKNLIFETLDELNTNAQIIFVSSDEQQALTAFRYNAVDFVLKPIVKETFIMAVVKVIRFLDAQTGLHYPTSNNLKNDYFSVSSIEKQEIFKISEIVYCSAEGRGTAFHLADGRRLFSSRNLKEYDTLMRRSSLFIKISRHYIINLAHVRRIIKKGGPFCELLSGISIPISRRKLIELNRVIFSLE